MAGAEWKEPKQDVNYLSKSSSRKGSREVREIAKRLLKSTCKVFMQKIGPLYNLAGKRRMSQFQISKHTQKHCEALWAQDTLKNIF
jgi:hypothetical protein